MKLSVINCVDWRDRECAAGHYRRPSRLTCSLACAHRRPLDASRGAVLSESVVDAGAKASAAAVPPERWPDWAKWVGRHRADGDVGVGSTIERMLGRGGVAFKAAFAAFGVDCGCASRRATFDRRYPYA